MKNILASTIILLYLLFPLSVSAHSGRTDSSGGHNCYVGSCAGTYHYHNGGGGYTPPIVDYSYLRPSSVKSGNQNYYTSTDNWCNYDIIANWGSVVDATGYSVSLTKTPGGNPGSISDTSGTSFTFKNFEAGTWYLNIKAGNSYGWGDTVYWKIILPKMAPVFSVNLSGDTLNYDFSCQDRIEAPQFFIDSMKNMGNNPKGSIKLQNTITTQNLIFKGTDRKGKSYEQTINYIPQNTPASQVQGTTTNDGDSTLIGLFTVMFGSWAGWQGLKWLNRVTVSKEA